VSERRIDGGGGLLSASAGGGVFGGFGRHISPGFFNGECAVFNRGFVLNIKRDYFFFV
jgi:hypothetical protein